ncbi:MAG TPA: RNA polymerase sigma factor [Polyangiaceae bacterium]|jgi:RNA polymerase sigma-70 factor (ECF subfamily)|nr:RNA polymerase sigma factor [Polyangiaceae bacterium]
MAFVPSFARIGTLAAANADSPTLEALMTDFADGQDVAFESLYRQLAPKVYGHLMKLSRDPELSKDVLQNTFAKIHRARDTYVRGAAVAPWVLVIARRALYDELRSLRTRTEVLSPDGVLPEPEAHEEGLGPEETRQLEVALSELPQSYREAIELTKLLGFSGGEAAQVLATTQSAVKLRVHRGYELLRRRLRPEAA